MQKLKNISDDIMLNYKANSVYNFNKIRLFINETVNSKLNEYKY